jgi:RimJ/RimL family protein N-acetyltransferase
MHRVIYRHAVSNKASQRVAEKCGFTQEGRLREETIVDGQREDMLLWSRLATDPCPEQLR